MSRVSARWWFSLVSVPFLAFDGLAGGGSGTSKPLRVVRAHRAESPLPLDGDLGKYRGAEHVKFEGRPLGGKPRRATVYVLWNQQDLYLAFDVHSSKLRAEVRERDGDKLWEDDGVEFLIDAHHDRTKQYRPDDFAYHINILNAVFDDRGTPSGEPDPKWNGLARHIVKIIDDYRYIAEAAIPWTEIGLKPEEGKIIGIDFCVNGKDPETGQYDYFDWCGLKVFHDPSGFGDLVLVGPKEAGS
jgi:hexosaminidase